MDNVKYKKLFKVFMVLHPLIALGLVVFLNNQPNLVFLGQTVLAIILILLAGQRRVNLIFFFLFGFFGAMSEILAIMGGAWTYSIDQFMGIPLWLIPLWGNAGMFLAYAGYEIRRKFSQE